MSCNQHLRVRRMAVEDPAALDAQPWKAHLETCAECRQARYRLERSLAVFRHFEGRQPEDAPTGPDWEQFSHALARSRRQRQFRLGFRVPLAAASLLVAVSSGALLWPVFEEQSVPRPPKIITLRPDQRAHLNRVLQTSLMEPQVVQPAGRAAHEGPAQAASAPARFVVRGLDAQAGAPGEASAVANDLGRADAASAPVIVPGQGLARQEGERAPVLLFRSLQQRRVQRAPVQVLPIFAPVHKDGGSSFSLPLQMPRPIR